jgi:hypothetical protein
MLLHMKYAAVLLFLFAALLTAAQPTDVHYVRHVFCGATRTDTVYTDITLDLSAVALRDTAVADRIEATMLAQMVTELSGMSGGRQGFDSTDLDAASIQFEKSCVETFRADTFAVSWYFDGGTTVLWSGKNVLSIGLDWEAYAGGAHPMHSQIIFNFDPHTGALFPWTNWLVDSVGFTKLAERHFWKEVETALGKQEAHDVMFDGGEFVLPVNIGISEEGVLLVYNEYEAAAYVFGPQVTILPFAEAQPFLKPHLLDP